MLRRHSRAHPDSGAEEELELMQQLMSVKASRACAAGVTPAAGCLLLPCPTAGCVHAAMRPMAACVHCRAACKAERSALLPCLHVCAGTSRGCVLVQAAHKLVCLAGSSPHCLFPFPSDLSNPPSLPHS